MADLDAAQCTAEEREEYEPHIAVGNVVFAGVDYAEFCGWRRRTDHRLGRRQQRFSVCEARLHITVADALRPRRLRRIIPARPSPAWLTSVINKIELGARPPTWN